jgi:DNA (cytosine-5)-methyltransferase 1
MVVNVGSLFAGIGGFDLGLERAGMRVSWQVELDSYCRAVLARHFPGAQRFEDVREVGAGTLEPVDLICGGFPCQDLSPAGRGAGLDGARSGLWGEFARIVCELRPRYVVVENVPALLTGKGKRWDRAPVGRVLGDLAEAGYDAEWACLSAREFGAPHLRKRVWLVAYPEGRGVENRPGDLPHSDCHRCPEGVSIGTGSRKPSRAPDPVGCGAGSALAYPEGECEWSGFRKGWKSAERRRRSCDRRGAGGASLDSQAHLQLPASEGWSAEPDVGRVADGVPARVDRLAALGNALLPQIAEWIGRRILEYEKATRPAGEAWVSR